jgi:hypothetical protein
VKFPEFARRWLTGENPVMPQLSPIPDPVSLDDLAARIRNSSNFRFNWQWYALDHEVMPSPAAARMILKHVIEVPECHQFLRGTFDDMYEREFKVEPIHEHCRIQPADGRLPDVLAAAAGDHLGAYSRELRSATVSERSEADRAFQCMGDYRAFELLPGEVPGCKQCQDYWNHLFTNWFYSVAWDWCFCAIWSNRPLAWVGCLTDTD